MKNKKSYILIGIIVLLFFYPIISGKIPFNGDLLVGAYYPWFKNIPVKNPLLSDVFSQFFIWKHLIANSYKIGQWPLWNQYSYSGYPLLANFNSGALNPFNLLLVFLGDISGWTAMVITQHLLMSGSMYAFLRSLKYKKYSSVLGALIYSFNGFAVSWSQFVNVNFLLVWIPLALLAIQKYKQTNKKIYISLISPLIFLMVVAGHFQGFVYGLIIIFIYYLSLVGVKNYKKLLNFIFFMVIGISLGAIQILPTYEMSSLSVRFAENYIAEVNYGLLPFQNIITILVPDYFGNPVTRNYKGFFNYHETVIYMGAIASFALSYSILNFKDLKNKVFIIFVLISLTLIFDNFLSKALYLLNFPLLSTFAAGRGAIFLVVGMPVLVANFTESVKKESVKRILIIMMSISAIFLIGYIANSSRLVLRNMIYPLMIFFGICFALSLRKTKYFVALLIVVTVFDLFRFFHKYTPFVDKSLIFPRTEVTDYLKEDLDLFRVEKTPGALLPPNTWAYYGISSTSGYDPLAYKSYVNYYSTDLNGDTKASSTRYSEISRVNSNRLGDAGVKYILSLDPIEDPRLNEALNTENVFVYKNSDFKPIFELNNGEIVQVENFNNSYKVHYQSIEESQIMVRITNYPGWTAHVDGEKLGLKDYDKIFMQAKLPSGDHTLVLSFEPKSFHLGMQISLIALIIWIISSPVYRILPIHD